MLFSSTIFAAEGTDIYLGASYNDVSIDFSNSDVDDTDGFGIVFGIDFGKSRAFEAEYLDSSKADMDYKVGALESAKIKIQSLGLYGVFRTTGKVYFKARAGIASNLVDITDIECSGSLCVNNLYDDDGGFAFSAGVGVSFTESMKIEAEYKLVNSDIDILGLGLVYSF